MAQIRKELKEKTGEEGSEENDDKICEEEKPIQINKNKNYKNLKIKEIYNDKRLNISKKLIS